MTNVKAILFDLDGTLLDTAPEFIYCLNVLLQEEGKKPLTVEDIRGTISYGAKGMVEAAFNLSEQNPLFESLKKRFLALYHQDTGAKSQLFPGVSSLIERLSVHNMPWGIVTNKPQVFTQALIKRFPPLQKALCVVSGDTLLVQKPDPAPLLHACQTLNVLAQDCWYLGDAKTDVEASRGANMRCAIANYGYIPSHENTQNWQADCYLEQILDIAPFVFA